MKPRFAVAWLPGWSFLAVSPLLAADLPKLAVPEAVGVNIHFTDPQPGEMRMLAAGAFLPPANCGPLSPTWRQHSATSTGFSVTTSRARANSTTKPTWALPACRSFKPQPKSQRWALSPCRALTGLLGLSPSSPGVRLKRPACSEVIFWLGHRLRSSWNGRSRARRFVSRCAVANVKYVSSSHPR